MSNIVHIKNFLSSYARKIPLGLQIASFLKYLFSSFIRVATNCNFTTLSKSVSWESGSSSTRSVFTLESRQSSSGRHQADVILSRIFTICHFWLSLWELKSLFFSSIRNISYFVHLYEKIGTSVLVDFLGPLKYTRNKIYSSNVL